MTEEDFKETKVKATSVLISLNENEVKLLQKRAKKNLMTLREQVEDIIRRSCVSTKNTAQKTFKTDDKLVEIFSRNTRGRKIKK
jgi:hypothetical protein